MKTFFTKKFKLIIGIIIISFNSLAQSPESMNYQAVIRNSSGTLIANQSVGIRIKILQGSANGSTVYNETFNPTTNAYGMVSLKIGTGSVVSGTFSSIDWGNNSYYVETAADVSGGSNYSIISTTQFMSVPYALFAKSTGSSPPDNDWTESGNNIFRSSGNVGIGTTTPSSKLDVNGTGRFTGDLTSSGDITTGNNGKLILWRGGIQDPYIRHVSNKSIGFFTVDSEKMRITEGGNVGIGTGNPTSKLDVNGDINLTGDLKINGVTQTFGGASQLNDLSDALIEDNSVYVGSVPSSTNSAQYNVGLGKNVLSNITTGDRNVGMGFKALNANTSGRDNTALGREALMQNTDGEFNVAIGAGALLSSNSADQNVAIGYGAMYNNSTGGSNVALGKDALTSNTTGYENTATGINALYANTTGYENTATGSNALYANTTGSRNTAIGFEAMKNSTTAGENTAVGYMSMFNNTGPYNVSLGQNTLTFNSGARNVAIGYSSLWQNNSGSDNLSIGYQSGHGNTSGSSNVALGKRSLYDLATGSQNTAVGAHTNTSSTSSVNQTIIGYLATGQADNSVTLGNSNVTAVYMAEDAGATIYAGGMDLKTNSTSDGSIVSLANSDDSHRLRLFSGHSADPNPFMSWETGDPLRFATSGSSGSWQEHMRIQNGNVGIGTTNPSQKLHVEGNVYAYNYWTPSDLRFKEDFIQIENALENVLKLSATYYYYKNSSEFKDRGFPSSKQIGFIAQDLMKIYPEIVIEGKDGYLTVDYPKLTPILVEAIKEQNSEIKSLKKELKEIKSILNLETE